MFRKMPFILIAIILIIAALNPFIPLVIKSFFYAISLTIKSLIIAILPIIIFGLLFKVMAQLAGQATKLILLILAAVCCSNYLSTFISHYVGAWVYHFDLSMIAPQSIHELTPLWQLSLPVLIPNDIAMYSGLILGLIASMIRPLFVSALAEKLSILINKTLQVFTYLIPFFVAGFVMKLAHDGAILTLLHDYALIFAVIALAQFSYIGFIYFITSTSCINCIEKIRNMLPAAIAGFSTMSSAAAMPLTIIGTEKNAKNPDLARSVIPATVNIHLIGDCFAIPILAFAILKSFGVPEPLFWDYMIFAGYFVLAKFSVAAVPGGGIIVMLPILESYLGFNSQMLSMITALYILFDPVITCANVLGNGSFAMVIDKLQGIFFKRQSSGKTFEFE
jgi:Na+/H+-dicarboxylate symporter